MLLVLSAKWIFKVINRLDFVKLVLLVGAIFVKYDIAGQLRERIPIRSIGGQYLSHSCLSVGLLLFGRPGG